MAIAPRQKQVELVEEKELSSLQKRINSVLSSKKYLEPEIISLVFGDQKWVAMLMYNSVNKKKKS